jgi:RNA polymerase sigma factor (sigma-70 family)
MNRPRSSARSRSVMAAVVLGTALTAADASAATSPAPSAYLDDSAVRDLSKYCQACWRNARLPLDRWTDCTQQVFVRLLERIGTDRWATLLKSDGEDKREFLRAIDAVKKRTQRAKRAVELSADVPDFQNKSEAALREQRESVRLAAAAVLGDRQRNILDLSAEGWSVTEIAAELDTTPERVSDEKYKAIRKLRHHLRVDA